MKTILIIISFLFVLTSSYSQELDIYSTFNLPKSFEPDSIRKHYLRAEVFEEKNKVIVKSSDLDVGYINIRGEKLVVKGVIFEFKKKGIKSITILTEMDLYYDYLISDILSHFDKKLKENKSPNKFEILKFDNCKISVKLPFESNNVQNGMILIEFKK